MVNAGSSVRIMIRARVWVMINARARVSFRVRFIVYFPIATDLISVSQSRLLQLLLYLDC